MVIEELMVIIDTVVLRVMAWAHPQGLDILFRAFHISGARIPIEVYNRDEENIPLKDHNDQGLSELARGLRHAKRQTLILSPQEAMRYQISLDNARQLEEHFDSGSLVVDPLTVEELQQRDILCQTYPRKCDRGEAACLVLAQRYQNEAVFVSFDKKACEVAKDLGIPYLTRQDFFEAWIDNCQPTLEEFEALVEGMKNARHGLNDDELKLYRNRLSR